MDDLISRAAVLNGITDLMKSPWYNDGKDGERHVQYLARKDAVEVVKVLCVVKEPAVDAVPVVRCRECRYWRQEVSPTEHWVCAHHSFNERRLYTTPDFYCADGERRDGA